MRFLGIKPSTREGKKYMALFYLPDSKRMKRVHFGAEGMKDYTLHSPEDREERKQAYLERHKKREDWTIPDTAGSLSRWILWNKPTLRASIKDYKRRFFPSK